MSANSSKEKYIIFHNKGKTVNTNGFELCFNENEPNDINNVANIYMYTGTYFSLNPNPTSRSNKLLGIHLDENLTLKGQ